MRGSRRIANPFDGFRLLEIMVDSVFDIDSVGFMLVSLNKRVKTNRRNLFVQVIRTMLYGLSLVISLGIEMRLSLYAITCCFILKRHAIFSFYLCMNDTVNFNITTKSFKFLSYKLRTSGSCYYRSSKIHWSKERKRKWERGKEEKEEEEWKPGFIGIILMKCH